MTPFFVILIVNNECSAFLSCVHFLSRQNTGGSSCLLQNILYEIYEHHVFPYDSVSNQAHKSSRHEVKYQAQQVVIFPQATVPCAH
jgi:hypothetical protein